MKICITIALQLPLIQLTPEPGVPDSCPMLKQVILIMEGNQYPFGQADESPSPQRPSVHTRTLVRKIYPTRSLQQRNHLLDKVHCIRTLTHAHLMRIEAVLEQQNSIHVLYEYVANGFLRRIGDLQQAHIEEIRNNVLDLAAVLAEYGLAVEWELGNIGISDKMETKYYLDVEKVRVEQKMTPGALQKMHVQSIMGLFSQFLVLAGGSLNLKNAGQYLSISVMENRRKGSEVKQSSSSLDPRKANGLSGSENLRAKMYEQRKQARPAANNNNNSNANRNKQSEGHELTIDAETDIKKPLSKSKTDWKQIDDQSEFVQQFLNVLDDKSENAQSKYLSDEEHEQGAKQLMKSNRRSREQERMGESQNEEEEIIWQSDQPAVENGSRQAEQQQYEEQQGPQQAQQEGQGPEQDQQEQVVWIDYRDYKDLTQRAYASMRKSMDALQMFRTIINQLQQSASMLQ